MIKDTKTLGLAIIGGIIPSLLWLWFWLKEDEEKPEPRCVLAMCFVVGVIAVIFVLPVEKFIQSLTGSHALQIVGWATAEEIIKFLAVAIVVYRTRYISQPIDWPIYIITTAVGFAAFENTLFLIKKTPPGLDQATVSLLIGHLRFLGATLLHTVSSGIIGISLGLGLNMESWKKKIYLIIGLVCAIALHSIFNFFIMDNNGSDFLKIFGFLWVVTIIIMLLFEKLRRMSGEN